MVRLLWGCFGWPTYNYPLEKEVSDAVEKESASPEVAQSLQRVFQGTPDPKKAYVFPEIPFANLGLRKIIFLLDERMQHAIPLCCSSRSTKSTNFPPPYHLSEFSSCFFSHYFQSLLFYLAWRSEKKQVHTTLSNLTVSLSEF